MPSRIEGKWKRLSLITGVMLLLGGLLLWRQATRVQEEAYLLAQTGREVTKLLSALTSAYPEPEAMATYYLDEPKAGMGRIWRATEHTRETHFTYYRYEPAEETLLGAATELAQLSEHGSLTWKKIKLANLAIESEERATARSVLWMRGEAFEGQVQLELALQREPAGWRIAKQRIVSGTRVTGAGTGFSDVAEASGIDFKAQLNSAFETERWRPERFGIARYSVPGVATADYDNDGADDLFFCNGEAAALYRNTGDGHFEESTTQAGLPSNLTGINVAIFADLDNDGHRDLFLGSFTEKNRLYRNTGGGHFEEVTGDYGQNIVAVASAADYDNDGDLDLYLGRYLDPRTQLPSTLFYTRNSQGNTLLRNDGNFRFTDVTEQAGLRDGGLTLGIAWADYDRDGDQDVYVANDFGRNGLYRNNGDGSFTDIAYERGALDLGYGMSASWGDINNDGLLDLYIANVHSGQRWYGQATTLYNYMLTSMKQGTILADWSAYREIYTYLGDRWTEAGQQIIKGNSLLLRERNGGFRDISEQAGANPFGWYWGSTMLDYNNDGRLDLYSANGFISGETVDDL